MHIRIKKGTTCAIKAFIFDRQPTFEKIFSRRSKVSSADWPLEIVLFSLFFCAGNGDSNEYDYQFSHGLVKWIGSYTFISTTIEFKKTWIYSL